MRMPLLTDLADLREDAFGQRTFARGAIVNPRDLQLNNVTAATLEQRDRQVRY